MWISGRKTGDHPVANALESPLLLLLFRFRLRDCNSILRPNRNNGFLRLEAQTLNAGHSH